MSTISSFFLKLLCLLAISQVILGQEIELRNLPNRKGIQAGYDNRRDETMVATKKIETSGRLTGKSQILDPDKNGFQLEGNRFPIGLVATFSFKGQKATGSIKEVVLVLMPRLPVLHGVIATRGVHDPEVYVPADSKATLTVDNERIDLGSVA